MSAAIDRSIAPAVRPDAARGAAASEPISLLVCALGGEGGGVLSEWLVETAQHAGYVAQSTSIPGVAQRTGATTYYVEIFPVPLAELGGRRPVLSLYPVPGALDAIVSSELLETARQVGNGLASPGRTCVITSSSRTLTTNERMQMADGRVDSEALVDIVRRASREHYVLDMASLTREAGTVVSAVMFGAIAASGVLPFTREQCERTIGDARSKSAAASRAGFALAFGQVGTMRAGVAHVSELIGPIEGRNPGIGLPAAQSSAAASQSLSQDRESTAVAIRERFPTVLHPILALGHARLVEYQDERYASLYLDRVARIVDAELQADPSRAHDHAMANEAARYLALWMAFDDIVRVAELKSRASRNVRVHREVRAGDDDIVRVYDHFKPGIPEIAALLPTGMAQRLTDWDAKRRRSGKDAWSMPLELGTHTIHGMLALRFMGGLKRMRRSGSRFAVEQALIERWLNAVVEGGRRDWTLGHELALCGRLIKGYGSTNERGKENLLHIVDHLATQDVEPSLRAMRIRDARTAALADENGAALDRTLVANGAPPREVKPVPIRFVRKATAAR